MIRGKWKGGRRKGKKERKRKKGEGKNRGAICSCDFSVGKSLQQVCVRLPASAVNVTLPAFAAERRAAAPQPLSAGPPCSNRSVYLLPAGRTAVNPQQRGAGANDETVSQTDERTNERPLHGTCSAYLAFFVGCLVN